MDDDLRELIDKWRDDPNYASGYEAGWHGRGAKTGNDPYIAGYRAALAARRIFEDAGFTRDSSGLFTKTFSIGAPPRQRRAR